jgi:hypothetical protein
VDQFADINMILYVSEQPLISKTGTGFATPCQPFTLLKVIAEWLELVSYSQTGVRELSRMAHQTIF